MAARARAHVRDAARALLNKVRRYGLVADSASIPQG